jgi:cytochrome o ubiquinol oxidase operon protein cyoD
MESTEKGTIASYIIGFLVSLALTLGAYFIVTLHLLSSMRLALTISAMAVVQATIQLFLFLHIGQEKKPHWKMTVLLFMVLVLVVIVFGSLWIMHNLNYNLMEMEPGAY